MTYRGDPVAQRLDRMAEATGVPALAKRIEARSSRPFRFLPLLFIIALGAGLWMQTREGGFGFSLVIGVYSVTAIFQIFGPLRHPQSEAGWDERERALVMSGHLWGLIVAMAVAVLGCLIFAFGSVLDTVWLPRSPMDWVTIAFFLLALEGNVATAVASWSLPRGVMRDEDEE